MNLKQNRAWHFYFALAIVLILILGFSCSGKFENKDTADYSVYKTISLGQIKVLYKEGPLRPQRWTSQNYFDYLGSVEYYEDFKIIKKIIYDSAYFYQTIHATACRSYQWNVVLENNIFKFSLLRDRNTMMKHIMPYNLQGKIEHIPPGEYFIEFYLDGELVNKDWFRIRIRRI